MIGGLAVRRVIGVSGVTMIGWLLAPAVARADADGEAVKVGATADGVPAVHATPPSPIASAPATDGEVPVETLCRAAVALALADPERARGFVSRARLAGWLPEVRFRVYRRFARTEGLSFNDIAAGVVAPVDISAIDDVRYEWRATWDLSRIVFNPDELQAHSEALRMADVRRDIQSLVIRLYFERRRLVAEARAGQAISPDAIAAARRPVRIAEIEAELDMLSNGAFSAARSARRRDAVPSP